VTLTPETVIELAALREQLRRIPFCPHVPTSRQRAFLELTAEEALFGGAAGGGKSDALLMAALQFVHVPGYSALVLRRTFADLALAGSIMDRAHEWLRGTDATWNERDKRWTFPSGAKLTFGYLETDADRYRYQGAEFQFVALDELTQFSEVAYTYLHSRLRRLKGSDVPVRMRAATNPGGIGHAWVKSRFVSPPSAERPFVRSLIEDNPHLDQDAYRKQLSKLDKVTRDQLEHGLWVIDSASRLFHYNDALHGVDALPAVLTDPKGTRWQRVFVVDLGASTRDPTTSQTRIAFHPHIPDRVFVEFSFKTAGMIPSTIAEAVQREMDECGGDLTVVMDEGALGHAYGNEMRSRHQLPVIAAEKSEKRAHIRLLNGEMERGHIHCVRGKCDELIAELETLIYDKRGLDAEPGLANHCADGLLYGWRWTYAHRSQVPSPRPVVGSPEWGEAEAARLLDEEYARARRARDEGPWSAPDF